MDRSDLINRMQNAQRAAASSSLEQQQRQQQQQRQYYLEQRSLHNVPDIERGPQYLNDVNRQFNHLRGSVTLICGDIVYLEIQKLDGTITRQQFGPFKSSSERRSAIEECNKRLTAFNAEPPMHYTNVFFYSRNPAYSMVLLDADCSEDRKQKMVIDSTDLFLVLSKQWGAKRLSDGSWCAFSEQKDGSFRWLHEMLTPDGRRFVKFADGDTLNYSRANLITLPETPVDNEIIQINAQPPSASGKYIGLNFEKGAGGYPRGRWRLNYLADGRKKSYSSGPKDDTAAAKEAARQECLDERERLISIAAAQSPQERTWAEKYCDDLRELLVLPQTRLSTLFMRNVAFKEQSHVDGFNFGPFLRGNLSKHARNLWCLKRSDADPAFEHFNTEAAGLEKLMQLNSTPRLSINAWKRVDDGQVRKILLETDGLVDSDHDDAYMLVSDKPEIISALNEHVWIAVPYAASSSSASAGHGSGFAVRNANHSSVWQSAVDLIAFVALSTAASGKPLVRNTADFFKQWKTKLLSDDHHDLRDSNVGAWIDG